MKRKILTLLLALAMVLTMLPMTALAADGNVAEVNGQGYSTLQAAINAVQTAGTVKLLENVTESVTIPAGATITLDLNGKTLVNSAVAQENTVPDGERKHTITNNGTLTIEDSVGGGVVDNVSHGRAAIYNNGTIAEIKGGKFTRSVDNSTDATSAKGNSWYVVFNAESGSIEKISGGEFLAVGNFSSLFRNSGMIGEISGGTFTQNGFIAFKNEGTVNKISGGTFSSRDESCIQNWGTIGEICGGTITVGRLGIWNFSSDEYFSPGKVGVISGGSISGTTAAIRLTDYDKTYGSQASVTNQASASITGGSFSGELQIGEKTKLSVSGGTFDQAVESKYLADSINAVLKTNDGSKDLYTYFASMDEAVQAAEGTEGSVSNPKANGEKVQVTLHSGFKRADTFVYAEPGTSFKLPSLSNEGYYVNTGWWDGSTFYAVGESYTVPSGVGDSVTLKAAWSYNGPVTVVTPSEPAVNPFNENAGKNSVKFGDVADNAWYASAVNYAVDKGLMNGTGEGKFSPEADTTRGMIVTILARLDGKNTSGSPWYQAGQRWAMEYEISDGSNMTGAITREQLVAMLFRYAVKNGLEAVTLSENLTQFTDASDISAWAVSAMQWAVGQGLIQGSNGQLRPQANASRAEVATILMRFCELLNK